MQTTLTANEAAAKKTIEDLIQTACSFDLEGLDKLYHPKLDIVMIHIDGTVNRADKAGFMALFQGMKDAGSTAINTWAEFHHVEANETEARVVLTRKNNIAGSDMILMLSIDLVHEEGRWQVLREVIFLRPDDENA